LTLSRWNLSKLWNVVLVLVCAVSMVTQLVLAIRGTNVLVEDDGSTASAAIRVVRFFSYFTIQSNIIAMVTAAILVFRPDRDGRWWRIVRIAAIVGMTVTFVVYVVALRPILDLHGTAKATDIGFHYIAPLMTMGGWLMFGPRPRIDPGSLLRHLIWPIAYIAYVLALGAATGWYPYPFVDVDDIGYGQTLLHALLITALLLAVGGAYYWADKVLDKVPTTAERNDSLLLT
jgi:hypothetical protein